MLPDVVLGCLHQVDGVDVPAEGSSSLWNPLLMNGPPSDTTGDNRHQAQFAVNLFHSGGTGLVGPRWSFRHSFSFGRA